MTLAEKLGVATETEYVKSELTLDEIRDLLNYIENINYRYDQMKKIRTYSSHKMSTAQHTMFTYLGFALKELEELLLHNK